MTSRLSLNVLGLSVLHLAVALVFLKGFLLTRIELPDVSQCPPETCSSYRRYSKAVVLIVDALRYDFLCERASSDSYYRGKLPRTLDHVAKGGAAAIATRFVADTPTITMSRLKALLTGGLPTFLDIGQSFSASALTEDNLLQQLLLQGKRLAVMGDDTWMQLAKEAFHEAYPYPSFDVHDLHTVDDGVWQHLIPLLSRPDSWDVLIAHYLGVDHAGHTYGVSSKQMAAKLQQMDEQVSQVIESLVSQAGPGGAYEDTLLLVLSDHGQTQGGDHGGGTRDETDSVLVAMSLRKMHQQQQQPTASVDSMADNHEHNSEQLLHRLMTAGGYLDAASPAGLIEQHPQLTSGPWVCNSTMSQIDLTPLIAQLLGVGIPFGNLGKVPPHLFVALADGADAGDSSSKEWTADGDDEGGSRKLPGWLQQYADALAANADQVHKYLNRYGEVGGLPAADLATVNTLFAAMQLLQLRKSNSSTSGSALTAASIATPAAADLSAVSDLEELVMAQLAFLSAAADLARKRFTLFQQGPIWLGCGLGVAVLVWQITYCWRAVRGLAPTQGAKLDVTSIVLFTSLAAFHVLGLFSVGLLMGEGRLQCILLAAATLLLLRVTLQAVLRTRSLALKAALPATGIQDSAADHCRAGFQEPGQPKAMDSLQDGQQNLVITSTDWTKHRIVVKVVMAAAVILACNVLLQALGLIDRSGQDPHDKTQPTADLLVGPDALVQRVLLLCFTVGPVIGIWVGTVWLGSWLQKVLTASDHQSPRAVMSVFTSMLLRVVQCCCTVGYLSLAAFWVAQLTGCNDMSAGPALGLMRHHIQQRIVPSGVQDMLGALLYMLNTLGTADVSRLLKAAARSSFISSLAQLPLRLLLPRVVYAMAVFAFGIVLTFGCLAPCLFSATRLIFRLCVGQKPGLKCVAVGHQQQAGLATAWLTWLWLCSMIAAAQVMVLGYKGPAMMLLALVQAACSCLLLRTHAAASMHSSGHQTLLKQAGNIDDIQCIGDTCISSDSSKQPASDSDLVGVQSVLGPGMWSMMSLQLFFCSSHFCEFSGLQYASAFIGFDNMVWYISGSLLLLNTCGFLLLGCLALPLMFVCCMAGQQQRQGEQQPASGTSVHTQLQLLQQQLTCGVLVSNSMRFAALVACLVSAAVQQQHILLWAIFAPKLVFELVFMVVTDVGHLLAAVLSEGLLL